MAAPPPRSKLAAMRLPDSWTERLPLLETLEDDWNPVPRYALIGWLLFYALFLFQAAQHRGFLLMIDVVFVPIHEGGHLLFGYFGRFLGVAGGTILQLLVPFTLAAYFAFQRQLQGTAFCAFFCFEQFLPITTYMADARAQDLPLLTVGDPEFVIHDWNYLFNSLGVLNHDTQIAAFIRGIGWLGMFATAAWFAWKSWRTEAPVPPARS